jgi:hypothetical protein
VTSASHRAGTLPVDRHARSACASVRLRDGSGQSFSTARAPSPRRHRITTDVFPRPTGSPTTRSHRAASSSIAPGQPRPPRRDLFPEAGHEPHASRLQDG